MTELSAKTSFDAISADLERRSAEPNKFANQIQEMKPSEQRQAYAEMTKSNDGNGLTKLSLAGSDDRDRSERANREALEPGGYNAFIGAKVPAGAVGVVTRFGKIDPTPMQPGWNWKTPLDHVEMISTRLHADQVRAQAASHDLQQVTAELTVPFSLRAKDAPEMFQKIGNLDQVETMIINPGVLESVKAVTAKFTAEELITKRAEVKNKVESEIKQYVEQTLKEKGMPDALEIGNVAITHFDFSHEFNKSVELKVKAEQDALRAENEKRQKITEAEAKRDAQKAEADGIAYQKDVTSKAEALAIERRATALRQNSNIVDLMAVERWDGKLPTYMGGGNPVPFINAEKLISEKAKAAN